MMNRDIFISYSSKQKSIADGVCHYLEENGFKCWMAPRDIPVGSDYGDLIDDAIKASQVVVLVFSESASISQWVRGEINVAFAENKPILPFRVDDTEIKGSFRVMLNQMHWIDAFPVYSNKLPDLVGAICGIMDRPYNPTASKEKPSRVSERLIIDSDEGTVLDIEVDITNENELIRALNSLAAIVETEGESDVGVKKAGQSRFKNYLAILCASFPNNKLIPYYSSKPTEWKNMEKKNIKTALIGIAIALGVALLLILIAVLFG